MFSHSNRSSPDKITDKPKEQSKEVEQETPRNASAKITERLNKVFQEASALGKNRSADLVPLTAEYDQLKHQFRALVSVVKNYKTKTVAMNDAKFQLAEQLATMSKKSPIYDEIGNDIDEETSAALKRLYQRSEPSDHRRLTTTDEVTALKEEYRKHQGTDILSMYGLFSFGAAQDVANSNEYQTHVVDYVVEWERVVTERIDAELKYTKELESTRRHYEDKIIRLREKSNEIEEKGKEPSKGQAEKLARNEDKLKDAFTKHERQAGKLCALIEAVTHEGYKDLYPLVKNYMKWEMNRISREHDIAERLSETLECMSEKMGSRKSVPKLEEQKYEKLEEPVESETGQ
ncbi:hypothetical protein IV203_018541 [Nitzschia inconspicua]|uniref:BAR domain-containing protein n=1 Tax=Nitzschia inconspicua TaxID=303405 RepID=A0A9K3M189_9STRA|nr:hypothetical protein IV203_018541 [Nitzschia inconspicua]